MISPTDLLEKQLKTEGFRFIVGVDEVGYGPLAGPVVAGAVVLPTGFDLEGIRDSKKLTQKQREEANNHICDQAISFSTAFVFIDEIQTMGIRPATDEAMKEAVCNLSCGDIVLVDGNKKPSLPHLCRTIIKGDVSIASIAAASIIAKVARDYYMEELHARYPVYGFAQHKGYGTTFQMTYVQGTPDGYYPTLSRGILRVSCLRG